MLSLFPLKGITKRGLLSAAAVSFLLTAATCMFQNWGPSFIGSDEFWLLLLWCGLFFIPAASILAVDTLWIPAATAVCSTVAAAVFGNAVREIYFCVSLPALFLIFAFRFFRFDFKTSSSVHLIYLVTSALFPVCTVWLIARFISAGLLFDFNWIRRIRFLYGIVPLLVIAAVFAGYLVFIYRNKQPDKKRKKKKGRKAGAGSIALANRGVSFWALDFSVGLFLFNSLLCFLLECTGEITFLPLPVLFNLTELLVLLSFIGISGSNQEKAA